MNRPDPGQAPDVQKRDDNELITEIRRYKLITPLFGGGVEPGKADPIMTVRATEVKGHLRFWWRATRGGMVNGDLKEMKRLEGLIWGKAATTKDKIGPSPVQVQISDVKPGRSIRTTDRNVELGEPSSPYSYVAFPLRAEAGGQPAGSWREDVEFALTFTYPDKHKEDVIAALWAWERFGGIGARTRRGFGALQCVSIVRNDREINQPLLNANRIDEQLKSELAQNVIDGEWPPNVPHLWHDYRLRILPGNIGANDAWLDLFRKLKTFRQSRFDNRYGKPYGRSKWPEPDAIRRLTGDAASTHAIPRSRIDKFPRAEFGLPIIFQFKDANIGDPSQTSLEGRENDRLASRLILRPIACAGGKAVGLALVLHAPSTPPGGLALKGAPHDPSVNSMLNSGEAKKIEPLDGNPDILAAFLNTL